MDDEPQALWLLRNILSANRYEFFGASSPEEMICLLETKRPHLVLLDLALPGTDGFELMDRIREISDVPIIFLSGDDQDANVARALNMGAEDYITKPFSSTELLARVSLSMRKRSAAVQTAPRQPYQMGDVVINYTDRDVTVSGRPARLSSTEYKLLFELSTNAGRVLTRDQILRRVWGSEYYSGEEASQKWLV